MAEEVELKLALADDQQARFLRQPLLKQALEHRVATLDNIYYDTPDLALRRRGMALRLRRIGRDWLQTVKLAGASAAGLSSRPEWETPYAGHFDFSAIDQPAVRDWLRRPKLLARIVPICETRFRRVTWRFGAEPGAVLLTLDRGWIVANGRREAISELELELDGATVAAIFEIAGQFAQRVAVTPAVLSKAERGYRLYSGAAPTPFRAAAVPLSATMAPLAACRRIALSCLEHLQQNHHGALNSDDPEYIHQMRVATRRLRAALRLFAPMLTESLAASLRLPLAALMAHLGRARDLDVLLVEIADPVLTALPDEPRLPALASDITNRRYAAREQALALLASPGYGVTLLSVLEALQPGDSGGEGNMSLRDFAQRRLRRLNRKLRRLATAADPEQPASLHALRIAVKRLRYALEFFAPLARANAFDRALRRLAGAQDTLGQLNDLANAGTLLMECAGDDPRLREAVTLIGGWHGPRHAALQAGLVRQRRGLTRLRLPKLAPAATP
ncbi:CYTH and CHAD domain-containing protein [Sulfuritalea sp.]|uniref:CYTH and CHAD domain-containing protein n=1 Tax=Sulfuritalea sp. TaxID=2480090 RepID=UPI001ACC2563|nr:CYTH and CHAD domain-containing protein [Sulfuritalea sp.]MBN8473424.1 CHAD domain-containing protein [Sulfuritalea sp.]